MPLAHDAPDIKTNKKALKSAFLFAYGAD